MSAAWPASAQVTTTYSYDPQGQVRNVARPSQNVAYTYDAAGNRTQVTSTNGLAKAATTSNQSSGVSTQTVDTAAVSLVRVAPPPPVPPRTPPPPPFPPPPPLPPSPLEGAAAANGNAQTIDGAVRANAGH